MTSISSMIATAKNLAARAKDLSLRPKITPDEPGARSRREIGWQAFATLSFAALASCLKTTEEPDAGTIADSGEPTPALIDDFEDGDNDCETFNGYWTGFNGFSLSFANGVLRASGSGSWPGFNVRASETQDVSAFGAIEIRIRSNIGRIKTELFDDNLTSPAASAFESIGEEFTVLRLSLVRDENAAPLTELRQFQIMAASENIVGGWIEVDEVRLV